MVRIINDIAAAGIPKDVALAIQFDPSSPGVPTLRYSHRSTRFWKIAQLTRSGSTGKPCGGGEVRGQCCQSQSPHRLHCPKSQRTQGTDGASVAAGYWCCRPRRFGAIGDFLSDQHVAKGQSNSLSIPHLREALTEANTNWRRTPPGPEFADNVPLFHVLGLDSCLMNMAEVCHAVRHPQLKGRVISDNQLVGNCLVASEGFGTKGGLAARILVSAAPTTHTQKVRRDVSRYRSRFHRLLSHIHCCGHIGRHRRLRASQPGGRGGGIAPAHADVW